MQAGIVPVRVDFARLILEWVMIALVAFALAVAILFTKAGVKPGVPQDFSAWVKSQGLPVNPPSKVSLSKEAERSIPGKPADFEAMAEELLGTDPESQLHEYQQEPQEYQNYVQTPLPPDVSGMHRGLLACFLLGVAALAFAGLYAPWLGRPQEDAEKLSANRPMLIPAGYAWLWHSYRVPARLPAKQAEK